MQLVEVAPHRAHINRKGRWSEQKKTPALASRGEKNHFYNSLILAEGYCIETERRNGHAVYRMGWRS